MENVDEAWIELCCHGNKTKEKIPPTKAALLNDLKNAAYQAGVWTTSELTKQDRPSPEGWGQSWDSKILSWIPVWTTLPLEACAELIKCGCKTKNGSGARCGCKKAKWTCTELCGCNCMKYRAVSITIIITLL